MADPPMSEQDRRDAAAAADVVSKHLPPGYSAEEEALIDTDQGEPTAADESPAESSLRLLGGDIHRDLYKINARGRTLRRAATFSAPAESGGPPLAGANNVFSVSQQRAPGGFRRQYMLGQHSRANRVTVPMTSSFVDFLKLYGHFAGEDLSDSDDNSTTETDTESQRGEGADETSPLLRRQRQPRPVKPGDASMLKSFFTLLKAFIGTGIMFLPRAFNNGGILFSTVTLVTVSMATCLCFYLLLQCRKRYGGSYGDLGKAIAGPRLRIMILGSITLSQIGFVCSSLIFVAENLISFLKAVNKGSVPLSTEVLIGLQLVLLAPLSFIRDMSKLGPSALLADVFIFIGLGYIYYYSIGTIAAEGVHPTVELFNPDHYTLTIGSSIFTFEGIGLILPIQSSMKEPEKFNRLLYLVMIIITIVFTAVGALAYATFGENTKTEVISNFPQDSKLVNAVQFLYSMAVLVGAPVQLFPAVRIMEAKIFGRRSGKRDSATKWRKNAFRTGIVILCGVIAAVGASDLDKFVALIGSFACVPLVYIYPAYLHYKALAKSRFEVAGDMFLMVVGVVAMVYTSAITILRWIQE